MMTIKAAFDELSHMCRAYWGRFKPNMRTIDGSDLVPGCRLRDNQEGYIEISKKMYELAKQHPKLRFIVEETFEHEGSRFVEWDAVSVYRNMKTETDGERMRVEMVRRTIPGEELRFYTEKEVPTFLEEGILDLENTVKQFREAKIFI